MKSSKTDYIFQLLSRKTSVNTQNNRETGGVEGAMLLMLRMAKQEKTASLAMELFVITKLGWHIVNNLWFN